MYSLISRAVVAILLSSSITNSQVLNLLPSKYLSKPSRSSPYFGTGVTSLSFSGNVFAVTDTGSLSPGYQDAVYIYEGHYSSWYYPATIYTPLPIYSIGTSSIIDQNAVQVSPSGHLLFIQSQAPKGISIYIKRSSLWTMVQFITISQSMAGSGIQMSFSEDGSFFGFSYFTSCQDARTQSADAGGLCNYKVDIYRCTVQSVASENMQPCTYSKTISNSRQVHISYYTYGYQYLLATTYFYECLFYGISISFSRTGDFLAVGNPSYGINTVTARGYVLVYDLLQSSTSSPQYILGESVELINGFGKYVQFLDDDSIIASSGTNIYFFRKQVQSTTMSSWTVISNSIVPTIIKVIGIGPHFIISDNQKRLSFFNKNGQLLQRLSTGSGSSDRSAVSVASNILASDYSGGVQIYEFLVQYNPSPTASSWITPSPSPTSSPTGTVTGSPTGTPTSSPTLTLTSTSTVKNSAPTSTTSSISLSVTPSRFTTNFAVSLNPTVMASQPVDSTYIPSSSASPLVSYSESGIISTGTVTASVNGIGGDNGRYPTAESSTSVVSTSLISTIVGSTIAAIGVFATVFFARIWFNSRYALTAPIQLVDQEHWQDPHSSRSSAPMSPHSPLNYRKQTDTNVSVAS